MGEAGGIRPPEAVLERKNHEGLPTAERRRQRRIELVATCLLGLATMGSAWCAYQATRWSGRQATHFSEGSTLQLASLRKADEAWFAMQIDLRLFLEWLAAYSRGDGALADSLVRHFRPELRTAFDRWLAGEREKAETDRDLPPGTPLQLPEYKLTARAESHALMEKARAALHAAREANQNGDNFVATVVLFALVLFFAGVAMRMDSFAVGVGLLAIASVVLGVAAAITFSLPQASFS